MAIDLLGLIGVIIEIGADPLSARLDRSERVNRVLQQCGIERLPSHADFDTIYAHTLVRYGVDKPSEVLDIFEDNWIKASLRDWFYHNDSKALEAEIENGIRRNVEAGNIRFTRIDAKIALEGFSDVFQDLVHKTRTPAEAEDHNMIREIRESVASMSAQFALLFETRVPQPAVDTLQSTEDRDSVLPISSLQHEREEHHADDLEPLIRGAVHSLAYDSVQEEQLTRYYSHWAGMNMLVKVTFSILDGTKIPIQVKYGILRRLDYESLRAQAETLVVNSFNSEYAAAQIEEAVLATIDVEAAVMALESFIKTRRSESDGQYRIVNFSGEIGEILIPFIDEKKLRPVIEQAALTGLPDYAILGRQIYELCGSAVITAVDKL